MKAARARFTSNAPFRAFAVAAVLACATGGAFAAIPVSIEAEYQLTSRGLNVGRVNESFSRKGDTYAIRSVTRAEGVLKVFMDDQITVKSSGRVSATGLVPHAYSQQRAKDQARDVDSTFDWERGVIRTLYRGERLEVALPRDTQDRLSVMYQFMNVPRAQPRVVFPMSNGRKVESYTYRFVDEVRIDTPAGSFQALHYERVLQPGDSHAEVWLAKDRHYLPVRVVYDDQKGLRLEQTLVALQTR